MELDEFIKKWRHEHGVYTTFAEGSASLKDLKALCMSVLKMGARVERERCMKICKDARQDAELRDPIEALDYVIHCINGGYK